MPSKKIENSVSAAAKKVSKKAELYPYIKNVLYHHVLTLCEARTDNLGKVIVRIHCRFWGVCMIL